MNEGKEGLVLDIHRFSLHDGPGIRTTVFLKGCPLQCLWCHNPESVSPSPEIAFFKDRCTQCKACAGVCPADAHHFIGDIHIFDLHVCQKCYQCVQACSAGSLRTYGTKTTVGEVLQEIEKDRVYYDQSGGGLTLSGGEPLFQPAFALEILKGAREKGIHTCIETSGYASPKTIEKIIPFTDQFLFDIKASKRDYKKLTGGNPEKVYNNLEILLTWNVPVEIRIPLIPGVNDTEEFLQELTELAASTGFRVPMRLMPFHSLGKAKLERFGYPVPLQEIPDCGAEYVLNFSKSLIKQGVKVHGVYQ